MDIQTEKIALVKKILDTEDEVLLQELKTVFETHEDHAETKLPDYVIAGVEKSREQIAAGRLIAHDEVMKQYTKYYKHL